MAAFAISLFGAVTQHTILVWPGCSGIGEGTTALFEFFPTRTDIKIVLIMMGEVDTFESSVGSARFIDYRTMRSHTPFLSRPFQQWPGSISGICNHTFGLTAEGVFSSVDHGLHGTRFGLSN